MAVTLSLRQACGIPVEVDGVLPERLRGLSTDQVRQTAITQGNARLSIGDLFDVSGSCDDDLIVRWQGDLRTVKRIGEGLGSGTIVVEGSAGMHLGAGMTSGRIEVRGDVGDWAGAEMRGGLIRVFGSAGDCAGGGYRGSRRGMTGGEILIDGDAGNETGRVMRKGLIAVGGACRDFCGSRMIAGTILVGGTSGRGSGAGMKRGTIGLLGERPPEILPTFQRSGVLSPLFLTAYARRIEDAGMEGLATLLEGPMQRWCGDRLTVGLGEILAPAAAG
ncbi:Formyltransferase/hydrolase complex Fhc subunit C [Caulifigura coniformis]|uniref:Formyltransferase/hydrolase complex Fhc subunit C n=1 Tax=Caulifigura coniformis TaxID=2527983 RepID=A0A517SFT4_9PLAN|nr:formylmethanofuran dehydrogenase subunit C [Caulifigura coniformis]QDT54991.1 Formyltransferase/hydrolase complex Fhc subunit C [Caulifigura coniformis]